MKKILVFDFDGTIIDSMNNLADIAAREMNRAYGISFKMARHLYLLTSGIPFEEQLELIFPGKDRNSAVVTEFEESKMKHLMEEPLFPEVRGVFADLKDKGYQLVISSSNFQHLADSYLADRGLMVDLVLGYKPGFNKGKDHFQYIINHFETGREQLVFIGDSLKDFERAEVSQVTFIGRLGTFTAKEMENAGVKYMLADLTRLEEIVEQL